MKLKTILWQRSASGTNTSVGLATSSLEDRSHLNVIQNIEDFDKQYLLLNDQKEYNQYKCVLSKLGGKD